MAVIRAAPAMMNIPMVQSTAPSRTRLRSESGILMARRDIPDHGRSR